MDYPRLIYLDEETETALTSYIESELVTHYGERSAWVDDLTELQKEYFAEPSKTEKKFPFTGAANLIIPLIAIVVEALHSKVMTSLFALEEFAVVKVPPPNEQINQGLSKFVNYQLLENGVDMYRFCDNAFLEGFKLGSMVGKVGWYRVEKTVIREIGDESNEFTVVTKQGPCADNVPLANFLMPFSAQSVESAPWVGEEHNPTAYEFKDMCDSGFFYEDTWEKVAYFETTFNSQEQSSYKYQRELEELQDQTTLWPKNIGFVEFWTCWNVDNNPNGKKKEIVVYYHRMSRRIIGVRYNWYDDLRKPYRTGKYFNVENRWAGIGAGKQTKVFQKEVTVQHRQRLDNATIANIRMFKINKMAGYSPGEPIFPGKLWFVDNMDDIESLEAGEVYPSSFNDEIQTLQYAQQRNGVNDLNLGMPQVGTPGTATSDMQRLQEGSRKYDYTTKNFKRFAQEIAQDVIYNACQFGAKNIDIYQFIPDGPAVKQFIESTPIELIRQQLIMNIKLVGQNENKLQERASWTQISGQLTQYYTQVWQFAQMLGDKNLMAMLAKMIPSGATEAMAQILQTYDIPNIDRIIPVQLILGYNPNLNNIPLLAGGTPENGTGNNNSEGNSTGAVGASETQGVSSSSSQY